MAHPGYRWRAERDRARRSEDARGEIWPLPEGSAYANLNTAIFDGKGVHWFTGQSGVYGRLDPREGKVQIFDAPKGRGPYGIHATPDGTVYYVSLAGSFLGKINPDGSTRRPLGGRSGTPET